MKLIDILVQELPKRGGWIKGHYQCAQDKDGEVCFYSKGKIYLTRYGMWAIHDDSEAAHDGFSRVAVSLSDDYAETIITRKQYEAALAASKTEWDGEGLPPVGVECEMSFASDEWYRCVIVAKGEEQIIYKREGCEEFSGHRNNYRFRPIRSEADKKRDEAIEALIDVYRNTLGDIAGAFGCVYDAIETGSIPHIRID